MLDPPPKPELKSYVVLMLVFMHIQVSLSDFKECHLQNIVCNEFLKNGQNYAFLEINLIITWAQV